MKAHMVVTRAGTKSGPFNGHPIRLTVGLIVRNEEKTLDKCLSSLKPLLEAVPSELIITDTGSTDRTIEIAQKYTSHIIHFEWCGDFSAARNTGLKEARGEWFLFLDGDEWFEDVSEIAKFFTSGECDRYGCGSYLQRNYRDAAGKVYTDFHALRMFRIYPGVHFDGIVHEGFRWIPPCKFFSAYVHHYGYAYQTQEDRERKFKRNASLLEQSLNDDPSRLKAYYQLAKEYMAVYDYKKAEEIIQKGLEIEKKEPARVWRLVLRYQAVRCCFSEQDFPRAVRQSEEFVRSEDHGEIPFLDCLFLQQQVACRLKQYDKALSAGKEYLDLFRKYQDGKLDNDLLIFADYDFIGEKNREQVLRQNIWCAIQMNDEKTAETFLRELNLSMDTAVADDFGAFAVAANHFGRWEFLSYLLRNVQGANNKEKLAEFITSCDKYLAANPAKREKVLNAVDGADCRDAYSAMCRLRLAELHGDHKKALALLQKFSLKKEDWGSCYSDVLYCAMKEKINIMPYILQIDIDDLPSIAADMKKRHPEFAGMVSDYFDVYSFENVKGLFWSVCLMEHAILSVGSPKDEEKYLKLFKNYAEGAARYVRAVYRPEMLTASNLSSLPRACRFGYYIGEALKARSRTDGAGYLAGLRKSLEEYPIMKEPVTLLLNRFTKEQKQQDAKGKEFAALAIQAKKQIEEMIRDGNLAQAGKLTLQLAKLLPKDKDVLRFRKLTHTEPTMREIASCLPQ
jgi:glycosyltransferase involved in cell wall biosynthesis